MVMWLLKVVVELTISEMLLISDNAKKKINLYNLKFSDFIKLCNVIFNTAQFI
jgi:hypothetical protein